MSFLNSLFKTYAPASLDEEMQVVSEKLQSALSEEQQLRLQREITRYPELEQQLAKALLGSRFLLDSVCHKPDLLFNDLFSSAPFDPLTPITIIDAVETACADTLTLEEFNRLLRQLRSRFISVLYWRMLNGLADFHEVGKAMTTIAEVFSQQALNFHYRQLCEKHGTPIGKDSGKSQPLLIVGMGKLGGSELNVSSDIDLIFIFPESGETNHKTRPLDNQQFFNRLGQQLIKSLNDITIDGFVFRVDMRLRPYGESGALTSNYAALENYYQTQGRDWERYAAIKARIIACAQIGDAQTSLLMEQQATEQFYHLLQPFIYRRYVDFSTIESLRQLKTLIEQEVRRKGKTDDVKLGAGGIREIEFIAQSFQLIRGGIDHRLQQRNLLLTLRTLQETGDLAEDVVDGLIEAYIFLRNTEHAIQSWQDAQTQKLPVDSFEQARLAWVMGFGHWSDFYQQLNDHRDFVSAHFQQVIADAKNRHGNFIVDSRWQQLWLQPQVDADCLSSLISFDDAPAAISSLQAFRDSRNVSSLSASARDKLNQFMPLLLQTISGVESADLAWQRTLVWLESTVTRTSYIVLLLENPHVLKPLVTLLAASSWVTETLTQMPSLLDELLHPEQLFALLDKSVLQSELRQRLLRLEADDVEGHMEVLRYFRLAHNLHVAASEVAGSLPLMKVSDYLSFTAEVVLEQVLRLAWGGMVQRHGYPPGTSDAEPQFLVVGYGKLGGLEMSYSSDLDLVFIYDAEPQGMTNGEKPLDVQTFYTRLGQKMIHILNTRTLSGQLYEVDMRLRPSGNSGLLVSSLAAFGRYQRQNAWVWEHQALVRARPIAGDSGLAQQFIELRQQVLLQARDLPMLREEVIKMRHKMREHLGTTRKAAVNDEKAAEFNLKQDAGGIVDIEFMVQYAVLAWAHQKPALTEWTDNIRLLERLRDQKVINGEQAAQLIEIYQSYRRYGHRLALQQTPSSVVDADQFASERQQVIALWDYFFNAK